MTLRKMERIESQERKLCLRCLKAQVACYCKQIRPFSSQIKIVLLQHPREFRKAIGTARMVRLCIKNSLLIVGSQFDDHSEVNELLEETRNYCVVLYPGVESIHLSLEDSVQARGRFPNDRDLVIFVIDGTWACAKKMLSKSQKLSKLPQICFSPEKISEYKIRQQPHPQCWSSIEATHRILQILDPAVDAGNLIDVFRYMVEYQVNIADLFRTRRANKKDGFL
jgi:DTW domain-containing protein YfiP